MLARKIRGFVAALVAATYGKRIEKLIRKNQELDRRYLDLDRRFRDFLVYFQKMEAEGKRAAGSGETGEALDQIVEQSITATAALEAAAEREAAMATAESEESLALSLKLNSLREAVDFWKKRGQDRIGLITYFKPTFPENFMRAAAHMGVRTLVCMHESEPGRTKSGGIDIINRTQVNEDIARSVDLFIIVDDYYDTVYHSIGVYPPTNILFREKDIRVVPLSEEQVLRRKPTGRGIMNKAQQGDTTAHYLMRSELRGGYAEFGTWFGTSFFSNWIDYSDQLSGDWYAFDSFGGLPDSREEEMAWTIDRDWTHGRYYCNKASFLGNGLLCGVPTDRIKIVEGFYDKTLDGHTIADYGIAPKSISFASIDCDLYDSTLSVLRFLEPGLDDGALIYFDDWLLARAGPEAGEYHAAQVWIRENDYKIDLVPLHRNFWAHQYMIFNRRWA